MCTGCKYTTQIRPQCVRLLRSLENNSQFQLAAQVDDDVIPRSLITDSRRHKASMKAQNEISSGTDFSVVVSMVTASLPLAQRSLSSKAAEWFFSEERLEYRQYAEHRGKPPIWTNFLPLGYSPACLTLAYCTLRSGASVSRLGGAYQSMEIRLHHSLSKILLD